MKIDAMAHTKGINPLLAADPRRRARWSDLTDPEVLRRQCNGISRIDEESIENKRIILEAMLDNQLRAAASEATRSPGNLFGPTPDSADYLYEQFVKSAEALNENTMGWNAAGTTPVDAQGNAGTETFRWTQSSLGVIRRMFPKLIAPDLVSVQPMSQPTGKAFYLYHEYADANAIGTLAQNEDTSRYFDNGVNDDSSFDLWDDADMAKYSGRSAADNTDDGTNIEGVTPRELRLRMNSTDIAAKSRKLANEWSVELEQDLKAYHGLSAESEILNATAGEMAREIDRDIVNGLHSAVVDDNTPNTMYVSWAVTGGYTGSVPTEIKAAQQTLYDALEDAAGLIEARAYVRPNWILTNVKGATLLRKLNGFTAVGKGDGNIGVQSASRYLGTLQEGYWNIYVDPWYKSSATYPWFLMGYKGSSFMEAGYVYAPYVPMYRTPLYETPKTFLKQSGIMSRYAKKMLQLRFYAGVEVTAS